MWRSMSACRHHVSTQGIAQIILAHTLVAAYRASRGTTAVSMSMNAPAGRVEMAPTVRILLRTRMFRIIRTNARAQLDLSMAFVVITSSINTQTSAT